MKVQEFRDLDALYIKLQSLPSFVENYIDYTLAKNLSPSSLLEYAKDFKSLFIWMSSEFPEDINHPAEIKIYHLELITVEHIQKFESHLYEVERLKTRTISRRINAIRSLFNYLHDVAENVSGDPLLKRNIFRKITTTRVSNALMDAREIQTKTITSTEADEFVSYVRSQYRADNATNPQAIWNYNLNGIRDICIINLMLRVGLLVSDIVNLNVSDITLKDKVIRISRQWSGHKSFHTILFGETTAADIIAYFNIRMAVYHPDKSEDALFLTIPNGQRVGKRMTKRAIQEMVIKYSKKYGENKITTRQLRHSFGIKHQRQNCAVDTKTQLALRNLEGTEKYQILTKIME
ncbi:MAG: tyrosine-type recombinase/integrase [Candidatus Pristimantibacillus sp.]